MKQAVEYICGLRYKLRMMDILCEDPTFVYGDNKLVLANTSIPGSKLKKKMNSLSYHFTREGCAHDEWRTAKLKFVFTYAVRHSSRAQPSRMKR